jgi:heterotetrameric sarcosine oxidase delta subunit
LWGAGFCPELCDRVLRSLPAKPVRRHRTGGLQAWRDYVFIFDNPKGPHQEFWQHVFGCRQWLVLERDTAVNRVGSSVLARTAADAGQSETRTYLKTSEMPHENPDDR